MLRQLEAIASDAVQRLAYHAAPALLGGYPGPVDERGIMTHVLPMSAAEYRDRVSLIVGIKSRDGSFHNLESTPQKWNQANEAMAKKFVDKSLLIGQEYLI